MKTRTFRIILVAAMLCMSQCGSDQMANTGGTGTEAEASIKGHVVVPIDSAEGGFTATLCAPDYLARTFKDNAAVGRLKRQASIDADGWFRIDSVVPGEYTLELSNRASSPTRGWGLVLTCVVSIDETDTSRYVMSIDSTDTVITSSVENRRKVLLLPDCAAQHTGGLTGRINMMLSDDTVSPYFLLYGIDFATTVPINRQFSFGDLAEGVYSMRIVPDYRTNWKIEPPLIRVYRDSLTSLGTFNVPALSFFKGCETATCDSLAVRSILDDNGLTSLPVDSVVERDPSTRRVVKLVLATRSASVLNANLGSLSMLRELDCRNNEIRQIPSSIGFLGHLRICRLDSNQLADIPIEVGYCDSLRTLSISANLLNSFPTAILALDTISIDISHNRIAGLPDVLIQFDNIDAMLINGNRLCGLNAALQQWLDAHQASWRTGQGCP